MNDFKNKIYIMQRMILYINNIILEGAQTNQSNSKKLKNLTSISL